MRRILAFLLSLVFIFTLFPTSILADDGEEIDENNINDIGTNSEEIPNENGNIPIITKFEIEKEVLMENEVEIEKELPVFYLIVPFDSEYDDIEWPETIVGYLNNSDSSSKLKVLKWVKTEDHFNEEFEGENKVTYIPTFDESEYKVANGVHLPYGVIEYQEDLIDEENVESTIEPTEEPSTEPEETETPSTTPEGTPEVTEEPSETENPTDTPEVTNTPEETVEPSDTEESTSEPSETPTVEPTDTPEVTEKPTETPTVEPTTEPTETPTEEPTEEPTEVPTPTTEPTQEPVVEYSDLIETEESKNEPLLQTKELSKETRQIINAKNRNETSPSIHELRDFPDTVILDDITIENFTVRWLSKSTGSDTSAKFDRLELVANDDNTVGNQQFQIDFKLSSQHQYEPGTIELVFPAYLWLDRDGNEPGRLTLSVPEEGEGNANFAWKRIGDNIIITNTRKLNASSVVMLQGTFRDVDPSKMVDIDVVDTENNLYLGISREFYVTLNIESSEGNTTSIDSNGIDASINTKSNIFKLTKTAFDKTNNKYKIWFSIPEDLPAEFIPENSDDYVYVRWYISSIISGSQEYTMYLEESVESNSKILGIQSDYSGNIVASDPNHIKEVIFDGFTLASKSAYVWMAYPKSMFNDEDYTNVENTATISIIGKDDEVEKSEDITAETPIKLPITYTIKKIWDDNDDEHGKRPTEIWYRIDYTYNDKYDYFYKYATEDTNWEVSWNDEGRKISYFVQEISNSLDGTHPLYGTYEAYYDDNGNKYIKSWNYSIKSTNYDSNLHTWTFTNEYSEGTHISLVSSFSKFNTQDQYSHTSIDYTGNKSLSTLYNQGSTEIPYSFESQIDFFTHKNNDYTPTAIIEDYNLKLNDIDLTSDEYEFNFITFSRITNYSYSEKVDDEGYYITYNTTETNPINIYGYINDEWTLIATYTKTEQTALVDGAEWIYTTRLKFPENVTKIKLELTPNETDLCLIKGNISVRLKLSDRIKSWIESDYENSIYTMMNCSNSAQQYIINKDTNDEILDEQFNLHQSTCSLWLHGRSIKVAGTLDKEFKYMDNDVVDRRLKFRSTLTLNLQSTLDNYSQYIEAINNGEIPNTNSGIYYDLLPYGVEPDLDSINVVGGTLKNAYVIENYKNSGRTLLVAIVNQTNNITKMNAQQISLEHREGDYPHDTYRNSHSIYFDCYYSWESAMEYGIDNMYNYAAYEADEEIIANYPEYSGEPNDPTAGNNITSQLIDGDNINLLTNLGNGRTTNSFIYGAALLDTSEIDFSALTSLQKHVSVSGTGKWGQGLIEPIDVQAGSYYTYRIYVQSATDTETSNIVLFDSIENYIPTEDDEDYGDTQWHGTFLELDVREMINMGANPIVYYSTVANLDISEYGDDVQSHLLNDEIDGQQVWSTTIPDNPSDVKAIAIDITKKQNGDDFILYPDEIAMAYIKMKAPEGEAVISAFNGTNGEDPTLNAHAYNGLWLSASQNTLGSLNSEFSHFEYTKLGIYSFNIYVEKVWDDENNNDGYRPNSITIHLYKDGVDTNETLILNEENEWKGQFENITKFNDDKIPYNYTISEDEIQEYTTQINQSFNHFTVTNTHIPEQVIITVDKTWIDDESVKDRIRPNYITYHLYSNGEELNKPSYTLTSSDNWTGEISVNKYLNGEIINYSIIENEVNLYKTTYSNEDYNFHIINTYYPYGDLSITKEIQNETLQSENQQFKLSISLVDFDGDDLIDKYYYESTTGRIGLVGNGDTLTISANETITIKDLPHNARYKIQEESASGWELIGSSNLTGLIKFNSTKEATLINKYTTSGRASISGHKELIGRELRKYLFQFNLYDEYNNHIAAASNDANGNFIFGDRKFSNEDNGKTFYYCIREQDKGKQGYTYDIETYYIVEIKPIDNGNGTMTCSIKYYIYDEESENTIEIGEERPEIIPVTEITQEEVIFRNEYHAEGYLSIRSWKDITGGKLENRQFTFKLESIANDNNEYYLTTTEHMDELGLILPPAGNDEEQEDPVPYITTGYNNSDGSIIFNTPFRDNKLRFTENDIGKTYRFIIYEVKDNDNRITYDDSIFGYEITVYDNGDGTLSFSSIPAKPITQSSTCEICNGTGTILTDPENSDSEQTICNNCNGTGYIIEIIGWETENAQIPVFHNKYNDGNLAITKLVEGENYDPNQEFTFHVKLIGDYNIDELEYMLSQFDSNVQHTLTIHYGYYMVIDKITGETEWTSITEDYTHLYTYKEEYNIQNPEVEGYTLSSYENEYVSGIMGLNNIEIYVEYTKNRNTTTGGAGGSGILGYPMMLNIKLPILMDIQPADDATIEQTGTSGGCTWELYSDGTLIVRPTDGISGILAANASALGVPWYYNRTQIIQAKIMPGVISNSQYNLWFYGCTNMIKCDVSNLTLQSNISDMRTDDMFKGCRSLTSLDLSNFDTSKVFVMNTMFANCTSLEELNLSGNFSTEEVKYMSGIFSGCTNLSKIVLGEHFKFKGRNITSSTYQALLPTPPSGITTGKWIREDEIYGPYTSEELKTTYDTNPELYQGIWIWQTIPTEYKIIFSTEDPDVVGSMPIQKIVATEDGIINENQFRKFAYKFIGWHDETNNRDWLLGENTEITIPANTYTVGTILTFTPIFEAIDTHVTIEDGEFVFTLHANETATFTLPAGITYQITEELPKGWTLLSQENSSGTIIPAETQNAVFTNQYIPNIVQVNIMGTKLLNGKASNIGFNFSLELINFEPVDENEEPILTREDEYQETYNNNSGMIMFNPLVFETVGTYHYKVVEIYRDDPFRPSIYSFDSHEEEITIVVSEDEDGTLYATVTKDEDGIIFRNYYKPGSLTIEKIAEGLTEANMNSEFTIRVKFFNENGTPLQDGAISYEVIGSTIEENREGESLLTIRYYDEDYNMVAPIYSEWLQEGSEYSIESPIIENMVTEIERVEGTIGTNNIYINVPYTHTGHKLTIRYMEAPEGYVIPENPNIVILNDDLVKGPIEPDDPDDNQIEIYQRYIGWFNEGEEYNIPNPEIKNYETINEAVSGIMGSENIEIIVYYTYSPEFTLTIKYGYWSRQFISLTDDYVIQLKQGMSYSIESPIIEGYTTNTLIVEGIMGNDNQTIYVEYVAK